MIVLHRDGRLVLIDQLDHAALAGRFAESWGNDTFALPEPLESVVLAAARHDEGWRDSDADVRYDPTRGAPLYFLDVDIRDYVDLYAQGIARIATLDSYAGLLVSMHGTGNVCGRWGIQRGIRLSGYDGESWPAVIERYVLEQEAQQARLKLSLLGLNPLERRSRFERRLWSNYELMQAWDRLSLFLCRTDPGDTAEADLGTVPTSLEGSETATLTVFALGSGKASVDPWPFRSDSLDIAIPVREISDRDYGSQGEVRAELASAPAASVAWTIATSPRPTDRKD
jgi:hypothetical protein